MTTKTCRLCGVEKDISEYYKNPQTRDNFRHECKTCCKWMNHKYKNDPDYRKRNREYAKAYYRSKHPSTPSWVCRIIQQHHEEMKDDPERLSTDFIQKIVGRKC